MSDVGNPTPKEYAGVSVEHPSIRNMIKNAAKMGWTKEEAKKRSGMPMEVVDRYYREAEAEKK